MEEERDRERERERDRDRGSSSTREETDRCQERERGEGVVDIQLRRAAFPEMKAFQEAGLRSQEALPYSLVKQGEKLTLTHCQP